MSNQTTLPTEAERADLQHQIQHAKVYKTAYFLLAKEFHLKSERWWTCSNLLAIILGLALLVLLIGTVGNDLTIGAIGVMEMVILILAVVTVGVDKTQCRNGYYHKSGHYQHLGEFYKAIQREYEKILASNDQIEAKSAAVTELMRHVVEKVDPLDSTAYDRAKELLGED